MQFYLRSLTLLLSVSVSGRTTLYGRRSGLWMRSFKSPTDTFPIFSRCALILVSGGSIRIDSGVSLKLMMEISSEILIPYSWNTLTAVIAVSSLYARKAVGRSSPDFSHSSTCARVSCIVSMVSIIQRSS